MTPQHSIFHVVRETHSQRPRAFLLLAILALLATLAACIGPNMKIDYKALDPQCRKWRFANVPTWAFASENQDMDSCYEHYVCMNYTKVHVIADTSFFEEHSKEAAETLKLKICSARSIRELYIASVIIDRMIRSGFDISTNKDLSAAHKDERTGLYVLPPPCVGVSATAK